MIKGLRLLILASLVVALFIVSTLNLSATPLLAKVSGTITVVNSKKNDPSNIAVWLEPAGPPPKLAKSEGPTIRQKGKKFLPHVIIATVSQEVKFPNDDPFPHNIFSNSEVKKFDLGLYQAGESRSLPLTRPGVIPVFCNIHPQMSAYIVVVKTPYYALSNDKGMVEINNVPNGKYTLKVWHEKATPETLAKLSRPITVNGATADLGMIQIDEAGFSFKQHKNKDEKDYGPGN